MREDERGRSCLGSTVCLPVTCAQFAPHDLACRSHRQRVDEFQQSRVLMRGQPRGFRHRVRTSPALPPPLGNRRSAPRSRMSASASISIRSNRSRRRRSHDSISDPLAGLLPCYIVGRHAQPLARPSKGSRNGRIDLMAISPPVQCFCNYETGMCGELKAGTRCITLPGNGSLPRSRTRRHFLRARLWMFGNLLNDGDEI